MSFKNNPRYTIMIIAEINDIKSVSLGTKYCPGFATNPQMFTLISNWSSVPKKYWAPRGYFWSWLKPSMLLTKSRLNIIRRKTLILLDKYFIQPPHITHSLYTVKQFVFRKTLCIITKKTKNIKLKLLIYFKITVIYQLYLFCDSLPDF